MFIRFSYTNTHLYHSFYNDNIVVNILQGKHCKSSYGERPRRPCKGGHFFSSCSAIAL